MNIERIDQAIAVMKRAAAHDSIAMQTFQGKHDSLGSLRDPAIYATTEEQLHACGNKACFAGYLAVSHEWRESGGTQDGCGMPIFKYSFGASAISEWLHIEYSLARHLIGGNLVHDYLHPVYNKSFSSFYNKPWDEVRAEDVIEKLEMIKRGELE